MTVPSGVTYHTFGDDPQPIINALTLLFTHPADVQREIEYLAKYFAGKQRVSNIALLGATLNATDRAVEKCNTSKLNEILLERNLDHIVEALKHAAVQSWPREQGDE